MLLCALEKEESSLDNNKWLDNVTLVVGKRKIRAIFSHRALKYSVFYSRDSRYERIVRDERLV